MCTCSSDPNVSDVGSWDIAFLRHRLISMASASKIGPPIVAPAVSTEGIRLEAVQGKDMKLWSTVRKRPSPA